MNVFIILYELLIYYKLRLFNKNNHEQKLKDRERTVTKVTQNIHYRSKVWGHPDNFVFSMKTHTFIYQMSCKMNRKYSQDIDEVRNNDFYLK